MSTRSFNLELHGFVQRTDLLGELVNRELKLRYKRSFLGILWSLINPLAQFLVLTFLFGSVLPLGIPNYPAFLFIGLLVWNWSSSSLSSACGSIVENRQLIRLPNFPVFVLPAVTVLTNLIHFLLALPIVALIIVASGREITGAAIMLPLLIALQFALTQGLAYIVSALHVRFRDTQHLVGVLLLLAFYLSPVFYAPASVPQQYQAFYNLNPMVPLLTAYRAILIDGVLPDWGMLLVLSGAVFIVLIFGLFVFIHASHRFVEEL